MKSFMSVAALVALGVVPHGVLAQGRAQGTNPASPPRQANCENYLAYGKLVYASAQYDTAYVAFRACVSLEPKNAQALYNLGRVETRLGLYTPAIEHLREAISVDAKFLSAYVALSQVYTEQYIKAKDRKSALGRLEEALRVLDDADGIASKNSERAIIENQRGLIYKYRGERDKALVAYKEAVSLAPTESVILFNLGALQLEMGQFDAAIETLRIARDNNPGDALTRAYLAKALRLKNDLKSAHSEVLQALNSSSAARKDPFIVGQYGIVLYLQGNLNGARTNLEAATNPSNKSAPIGNSENYFYLGRVYLDLGEAAKAKIELSKATVLEPRDEAYWFYLGRAHETVGDKENARKAYEQALKLKGNYKDAQDALNRLK